MSRIGKEEFLSRLFDALGPIGSMEEGVVKTSNARIEAEEIELSKSIHLQTSNGPIFVKNSRSEKISANSTNSRIEVEKCVCTKIHCHTTNARVCIEKCDNAEVKLSSTNGSIHAQDCRLKALYCGTTNGVIKVEEISADTIELSATNGSVSGNIHGCEEEFSIDTNTTNGSNNLRTIERANAHKRLCAHTTNGSIKIQFVS